MRRWMILAALFALLLPACGTAPRSNAAPAAVEPSFTLGSLEISDVWSRATAGGGHGTDHGQAASTDGSNGVIYMTIRNTGSIPDRLLRAESDAARTLELHTMTNENGVMKMDPVAAIVVPAQGSVTLKPGGLHLMLLGVTRPIQPGDTVKLRLQFERAGAVDVQATARAR